MVTTCQISGDHLTLHLSAALLEALGIQNGSPVTVDLVGGSLVIQPQSRTRSTLKLPTGVTPSGGPGWNGGAEEVPSSDHALLSQITGLDWSQLHAVVHQGADAPPTISQHQIATNLAALLSVPFPNMLPALGLGETDSTSADPPSPLLLDRVARVLGLFTMIRAVLGHEQAVHWFSQPNPHLGGLQPLELCHTLVGQLRLRDHLDGLLAGNVL